MPQVNGDNLLHQQIVKRTIEALQAQDEAFARKAKNLGNMMEELGRYISKPKNR